MNASPWYRDHEALSLIMFGYLPWLAGLNLAWEAAHLPLYTVWREASAGYLVFTVVHCTLGDLAIGVVALVLALVLTRSPALAGWSWGPIIVLTVIIGSGYTVFSEWMNVTRNNWTYSDLMPVIELFGFQVGLSPLSQWLLLPALALHWSRRRVRVGSSGGTDRSG